MADLESGFERKAQAAFAEDIHDKTVDERDNVAFRFRQRIADGFRDYAARHGYNLGDLIDSLRVTEVDRNARGVFVRIEGDHPLGLFETGAAPHPIEPVDADALHWVDPETGEDVFAQHVDHPGLPESRAIRDALHWLRRDLQN